MLQEKKNNDFCNLTQATYIIISWVYPCSMFISVLNNIHGTQKLESFVLDRVAHFLVEDQETGNERPGNFLQEIALFLENFLVVTKMD